MSYSLRCKYCGKNVKARDAGNMRNVMTTHVLTKCSSVSKENREMWRITAIKE